MRGAGDPLLVLLHGLNATAAVWEPLDSLLATSWSGRRLLVDLPGHGRSDPLPDYSFGVIAAEVARAIGPVTAPVTMAGHSMGAVVALTLATGWFGLPVATVLAVGVKLSWSVEDLDSVQRALTRPVKWYGTREEAQERFVKLAGVPAGVASDPGLVAGGVHAANGRFRVAADPRASSIGGPPMDSLMAAVTVPVRLARGDSDEMVGIDELQRFDPDAAEVPDAGHNAHLDNPAAFARLIPSGRANATG